MSKIKLKKKVKRTITFLSVTGMLLIMTSISYCYLATPVDKNNNSVIEVNIESGMSSQKIGKVLESKKLIRNSTFFLLYLKLNNCNSLKAATYNLKKSMTLDEILNTICKGNSYNKNAISITFKEGKRITDYAQVIEENTTNQYDDIIKVFNDREYLKTLIDKYWFLTDDILNENIYYPLEGYLFSDTYEFKNKEVTPQEIVETMLDREEEILNKYKEQLTNGYHKIHEYITLASMTELEGTNTENRKMIAGIFENRININMSLGSDVTTYYALQKPMTQDLTTEEFATNNPYNTRNINKIGLPIGPICSISTSSIEAAINVTQNEYYYFVADKLGNIYYTKNSQEHLQKVKEIKDAGNWIW